MIILWMIALVVVVAVAVTYAWGAWRAAPFVPTRQRDVERMLFLAEVQPGQTVVDLGAGDGRFLLTAARRFKAKVIGYEISLLPYLIGLCRLALARDVQAKWKFQDFFRVNLQSADVVVCFLTPGAMAKLAVKFQRELRPGTKIVSYAFALPGWIPLRKDKPSATVMAVYLYQR